MGNKKDPGKFTIRFNIADPQQQAVAELLNRQGRYKAQFITNAVMLYVHAAPTPLPVDATIQQGMTGPRKDALAGDTEIAARTGNRRDADSNTGRAGADMDSILRTMDAFHSMNDNGA